MALEDNLIAYWHQDAYHLAMWDTGRRDPRGQTLMHYKLWHKGKLIFDDRGFAGSPLHADDSPQTIASLLNFLSLRPGDTDREYFDSYTPEQLEWAESYGEELGILAMEERRSG